MARSTEVKLLDPFEHHEKTVGTITVKEPAGGAFSRLGEPRIFVRKEGGGYWVEQPDVIRQYLDASIDHQDGAELLRMMSLADAMQVKDAVLGFFSDAERRIAASRSATSPSA